MPPSSPPGPPSGPPEPTQTHPGSGELGRPGLRAPPLTGALLGAPVWRPGPGPEVSAGKPPSDFQAEGDLRRREGDSSLKLGARWGPGPGPRVPLPLPPCLPHPTPSPPPSSLLPSPTGPSHLSSARPHELDPVSPTLNLAMAPHALGRKYGSSPRPTRPCMRQSRPLPGYLSSLQRLVPRLSPQERFLCPPNWVVNPQESRTWAVIAGSPAKQEQVLGGCWKLGKKEGREGAEGSLT